MREREKRKERETVVAAFSREGRKDRRKEGRKERGREGGGGWGGEGGSSQPAGERLDYGCKEGVSQHKQPLASWQCLSPFRAPAPLPPTHPHLPSNHRIYTPDETQPGLYLTLCTSDHFPSSTEVHSFTLLALLFVRD